MIVDQEFRDEFRKKLSRLVDQTVEGLSTGNFYDANGTFQVSRFERERGVIIGLGYALNLLENKPIPTTPAETQSEDVTHETDAA